MSGGRTGAAAPAVDIPRMRSAIDAALTRLGNELLGEAGESHAVAAARYALRGPGKRLRGLLVCAVWRAAGGSGDPLPFAVAVEMVHSYSLVHDDLPCIDDDDVRRGRPATHRVHSVPAAIAAGTLLLAASMRTIAAGARTLPDGGVRAARAVRELYAAAGAAGMIAGQWRDLQAEGATTLDTAAIEELHRAKTGALIAAAARLGGIAAGAGDPALDALGRFGSDIGLAFQITDDVLDVTGTSAVLGKTTGRDASLRKSSYAERAGVAGALERGRSLVRRACDTLNDVRLLTPELRYLADLAITRTY